MNHGAATYQTAGLRYSAVLISAVNGWFDPTADHGPNHRHFLSFHGLCDILHVSLNVPF